MNECDAMKQKLSDRDYYRTLRRSVNRFHVNLDKKKWCDLWHAHFDWNGRGNMGWVHRRRHLSALLRALTKARLELSHAHCQYQLFAVVYPHSSADDAIYVHTQNPNNTEFPYEFTNAKPVTRLPPLLSGRLNLDGYLVFQQRHDDCVCYVIQSRGDIVVTSSQPSNIVSTAKLCIRDP